MASLGIVLRTGLSENSFIWLKTHLSYQHYLITTLNSIKDEFVKKFVKKNILFDRIRKNFEKGYGNPIDIKVNHGDIYIMSEKATGFDWKSRSKVRVVHAAGYQTYLKHKV